MRASLSGVIRILGQPSPPKRITQQPFDYNPSHYRRLCHLDGAAPNSIDLYCYAEDIEYMTLQPDLLRYLLPICLKAWQDDLFSKGTSEYAAFSERFWTALAPRTTAQNTFVLEEELNANEYRSVVKFMQNCLLDRMDQETHLHFTGSHASPYQWFYNLGSFGIVFPHLPSLWNEWWQMNTPSHAVCVLQYISCLMYWDDENPVFPSWTPDHGGGPPELWESNNYVSDYGWRQENVSFLAERLTVEYTAERMKEAAALVGDTPDKVISAKMLADWPQCCDLVASRIAELPKLVALASLAYPEWSV